MKKLFIIALAALGMLACSDQNAPVNPNADGGALPGKFSVSRNKQIQFSQGNLQYRASNDTWRFAENQYDIVGKDNENISNSYSGWIDLFCWGTGDNPTLASVEEDYEDGVSFSFVDWGKNAISNGGDKANMWRTLTGDEWYYLFVERTNADKLFGLGSVEKMDGLIILPDNWQTPAGVSFVAGTSKGMWYDDYKSYRSDSYEADHFTDNVYTKGDWLSMEKAGAIFLPVASLRYGQRYLGEEWIDEDEHGITVEADHCGYYWSSSPAKSSKKWQTAQGIIFSSSRLYVRDLDEGLSALYGLSVRLVKDVK